MVHQEVLYDTQCTIKVFISTRGERVSTHFCTLIQAETDNNTDHIYQHLIRTSRDLHLGRQMHTTINIERRPIDITPRPTPKKQTCAGHITG